MSVVTGSTDADKQIFRVQRAEKGVLEATAIELGLVVRGRSLDQLRRNIAAALRVKLGKARSFAMTIGHERDLVDARAGERFVMTAQPPKEYTGSAGARVIVVSTSDQVCVKFDSGLRESFPKKLFRELFKPET